MKYDSSTPTGPRSGRLPAPARVLLRHDACVVGAAVVVIALWITAGAVSKSYLIGRLADPTTHNDVNYLIDGIRRLLYVEVNGFWAEFRHLYGDPLHAPLSGYQAALGFYLFGFHDWAPYLSNGIYVLIFLAACALLLRGLPNLVVIAALLAVAGAPLVFTTVSEYSPELPLGLFTALGVLLALRIPTLDRDMGGRAVAGLCFGLGLLAKPTSLVFVPLVVCATLAAAFIRDIVLPRRWDGLKAAICHGGLQLLLSLWLPALYVIPNFHYYSNYFYRALFDKDTLEAFGYLSGLKTNILYYLTGQGGEYMFGNFLWAYVGTIAIGLAAASARGDRPFISRQWQLLGLVIFMWLLPTASAAKNTLFGAPFSYLLLFMVVMALGSIFAGLRGVAGAVTVSLLSLLLLVSSTARPVLNNAPGLNWAQLDAHIIREKWPEAQDRLRAVMLGNSPNYYGQSVYLTNGGYYNSPALWYWFLKKDPSLDWVFHSLWQESDPRRHLEFINERRFTFVVAGERDNGLTFAPSLIAGAAASENAALAALWDNPAYMPIDRFYGPTGRTITVFQRRARFAGWRPIGGLRPSGGTEQPWISEGTTSLLEAYAPDAVAAELMIDASGPAGQTIDIVVNKNQIGRLTLDASGRSSSMQSFSLAPDQNDILFRYASNAPVKFERLLLLRKIKREP
jgi:Dolichyl-phosphate-mannose-protein mannosyltransferase